MAVYYWRKKVSMDCIGDIVECAYEPVRIKWDSGYMDICPPAMFEELPMAKIRKIFKQSVLSDLTQGTHTVKDWKKAIKFERDFYFNLYSLIENTYNRKYSEIVDRSSEFNESRGKELTDLQRHKVREIKYLDSRKKKLDKCTAYLDELVKKYKVKE